LLRDPKGQESRERFLALAPGRASAAERDCFAADLAPALEVVAARGQASFSARERTLLALLGQGLSSKPIAACLGLSVHTSLNHRRRIGAYAACQERPLRCVRRGVHAPFPAFSRHNST
jgi:DNA-binding CsgD family transcriptional regulator